MASASSEDGCCPVESAEMSGTCRPNYFHPKWMRDFPFWALDSHGTDGTGSGMERRCELLLLGWKADYASGGCWCRNQMAQIRSSSLHLHRAGKKRGSVPPWERRRAGKTPAHLHAHILGRRQSRSGAAAGRRARLQLNRRTPSVLLIHHPAAGVVVVLVVLLV